MTPLAALLTVVLTVLVMEFGAYAVHRWIMHGPGWGWHRSHHEEHDDALEKNDLYALVFAGLSVVFFWAGHTVPVLWWVGVGLVAYGVLYFILHDGLVHQRWPFRYVPKTGYLRRLYQAHRLHHAVEGRDGCVSFGFLYAPPVRRLKEQLAGEAGRRSRGAQPPEANRPAA